MIDDDAEYEMRRQIRAKADEDVASFVASLDQDQGSGIPAPSRIEITEVSTKPVKFSAFAFGREESQASPGIGVPPTPIGCPSTVIVTFHDVVFDCGCVLRPIGSGDLTDVGLFNDIPVTLTAVVPVWDPACQSCLYEWSSGDLAVHAKLYSNTDCTDMTSESDTIFSGNINLWKDLGNLWHLRLDFVFGMPLVFYGTSTSLSLPFNNLITCSHDLVLWPNTDCTFDFYDSVGGHGGHATIVAG